MAVSLKYCLFRVIMILSIISARGQSEEEIQGLEVFSESIAENSLSDEQTGEEVQDLLDNYLWLSGDSFSLDEDGLTKMLSLRLIDESEERAIRHYIYKYGKVYSLYELGYIEGVSPERARELFGLIRQPPAGGNPVNQVNRDGRLFINQELMVRYGRTFPANEGFYRVSDTLTGRKVYPGTPERLFVRYCMEAGKRLRAGFTLEKDPGETLESPSFNIKNYQVNTGFDFQSGYLLLQNLGFLKTLVVGDYQVRVGQGLNFWSGYSFNHRPGSRIYRAVIPVKPYTSSNETGYLRGVAARMEYKKAGLVVFFSDRKVDATDDLDPMADSALFIKNFRNSGYHRTEAERSKKHNYRSQLAGASLMYDAGIARLHLFGFHEGFNAQANLAGEIHNQFNFNGKSYQVYGGGMVLQPGKVLVSADLSLNDLRRFALTLLVFHAPADHISLAIEYRRREAGYVNLFSSGKFRSPGSIPEEGVYVGLDLGVMPGIKLISSINYTRVKWLRSNTARPCSEVKAMARLEVRAVPDIFLEAGYTCNLHHEKDRSVFSHIPAYIETSRHNLKVSARIMFTQELTIRPVVMYSFLEGALSEKGCLVSFDIYYDPDKIPFSVRLRLSSFHTSGYESRLYLYEHDVYGSASMPSSYGRGNRIYLAGKWRIAKFLDLWIKAGMFHYPDRGAIGSGYDLVTGNRKMELKLQARFRF